MKSFFKNRCVFSLIIIVIVLGIFIGVFNAVKKETTVIENVTGVIITPVQQVFTKVGSGVSSFFGYFADVDELRKNNEELKSQIAELKREIRENERSKNENEELRNMLNLKSANPELDLVCAEIIARDPSNWYNTITLDKGTVEGVSINQPVITKGKVLVGRVSDVGTTWAEVTLITDPEHGAGVRIVRSDELAIIEGDGFLAKDGNCKMSFISKNSNILAGDTIETSGLGGIYPKGLMIGKVVEISPEVQGISQYAVVKPEADVNNLRTVFVVTNNNCE